MDEAEADVIAPMAYPKSHWLMFQSRNPIERLNKEVKRRADAVAIFPNKDAIEHPVGAILLEQDDERAVQRSRTMTLESIAPVGDDDTISLPTMGPDRPGQSR